MLDLRQFDKSAQLQVNSGVQNLSQFSAPNLRISSGQFGNIEEFLNQRQVERHIYKENEGAPERMPASMEDAWDGLYAETTVIREPHVAMSSDPYREDGQNVTVVDGIHSIARNSPHSVCIPLFRCSFHWPIIS